MVAATGSTRALFGGGARPLITPGGSPSTVMPRVHLRSITTRFAPLLCGAGLLAGLATGVSGGCARGTITVKLDSSLKPAQRAANSFVHCVEMETSHCIQAQDNVGGWDAFYILGWLAGGTPVSILEALPTELSLHADPRLVQRRLVSEVERYALSIRGAECEAGTLQPIGPLIDKVAQVAAERMTRLGLWQGDMTTVMQGLVDEAHESLGAGFLVEVQCQHNPHRFWVATRDVDGRHSVVGLTTDLPELLGGHPPPREEVASRLSSRALGLARAQAPVVQGDVDPWIAFPIEEF